ncbi:MAG: hypothetical protein Q9190_006300 [Brigantiaea leucoxantha]
MAAIKYALFWVLPLVSAFTWLVSDPSRSPTPFLNQSPSAGYMLSAVFICAEYQRLGMHFRQHRVLRASFWMKLLFILVEFAFAVVFAATTFTSNQNVAAVFEWVIALIFTFYVFTFSIDLLPASRRTQMESNMQMGNLNHANGPVDGEYGYDGTSSMGLNGQQQQQQQQQVKPPMAQNY